MRSALEALFDAMITEGWCDESSGDVEAPTGHFAKLTVSNNVDRDNVLKNFSDVVSAYGTPPADDMIGNFVVRTDNQGFIYISKYESPREQDAAYTELSDEYDSWGG